MNFGSGHFVSLPDAPSPTSNTAESAPRTPPLKSLRNDGFGEMQLSGQSFPDWIGQRGMPPLKRGQQRGGDANLLGQLSLSLACQFSKIAKFSLTLRYANQFADMEAEHLRHSTEPVDLRG